MHSRLSVSSSSRLAIIYTAFGVLGVSQAEAQFCDTNPSQTSEALKLLDSVSELKNPSFTIERDIEILLKEPIASNSPEILRIKREAQKDPERAEQIFNILREDPLKYFTAVQHLAVHAESELPFIQNLLKDKNFEYARLSAGSIYQIVKATDLRPSESSSIINAMIAQYEQHDDYHKVGNVEARKKWVKQIKSEFDLTVVKTSRQQAPGNEPNQSYDSKTSQANVSKLRDILESENSTQEQINEARAILKKDSGLAAKLLKESFARNIYDGSETAGQYLLVIERLEELAISGLDDMLAYVEKWNQITWRRQYLGHAALVQRAIEKSDLSPEEKADALAKLAIGIQENPFLKDLRENGDRRSDPMIVDFQNQAQRQRYIAELAKYNVKAGNSYLEYEASITDMIERKVPAELLIKYMKLINSGPTISKQEIEKLHLKLIEAVSSLTPDLNDEESRKNRVSAENFIVEVLETKTTIGTFAHSSSVRLAAIAAARNIGAVRAIPALIKETEQLRDVQDIERPFWFDGREIVYSDRSLDLLETISSLSEQNARWSKRPDRFPKEFFPTIDLSKIDIEPLNRIKTDSAAPEFLKAKAAATSQKIQPSASEKLASK